MNCPLQALSEDEKKKAVTQTYELAEECFKINYYGTKIATESLLPLLKLSDSPRIVNVSSTLGKLEVTCFTPCDFGLNLNEILLLTRVKSSAYKTNGLKKSSAMLIT